MNDAEEDVRNYADRQRLKSACWLLRILSREVFIYISLFISLFIHVFIYLFIHVFIPLLD